MLRRSHAQHATVAFSADLAPDLLVPWRHPTLTVVYTDVQPASITDDLVPAEGHADAGVVVRWTNDTTMLAPAATWPQSIEGIPFTDPVQQWWDLLDLAGEDRREAADRLRTAILERSLSESR